MVNDFFSHLFASCTMERVEQRVDRGRDKQILIPGLSVRCHGIQVGKMASYLAFAM